jgi:hypothetical protein
VCILLAYLTAYQMLTRYRRLLREATILVIGASGTVGTARALTIEDRRGRLLDDHEVGLDNTKKCCRILNYSSDC